LGLDAYGGKIMSVVKLISLGAILVAMSAYAIGQQAASDKTTVRHVPITNAPSNSGKEMFNSYCAVCHGKDGKGSGPAASAMKTAPVDLTALAQKNGGKYPGSHVASVIRGQAETASHGSQDMPVWGPLFSSIDQGHQAQTQQRISNLVSYIDTLQAK
jgi:mono/diheme cytochrome c family protein